MLLYQEWDRQYGTVKPLYLSSRAGARCLFIWAVWGNDQGSCYNLYLSLQNLCSLPFLREEAIWFTAFHCFSLVSGGFLCDTGPIKVSRETERFDHAEKAARWFLFFFFPLWISKRIFFLVLLMLRSSQGPSLLTSLLYNIFEDSWQKEGVLSLDVLVSSVSAHRQYPGGTVLIDIPTSFHASFSLYCFSL